MKDIYAIKDREYKNISYKGKKEDKLRKIWSNFEHKLHKTWHTNNKKAHEKMLNIISLQYNNKTIMKYHYIGNKI